MDLYFSSYRSCTGNDSLVVRASASGAVGNGFAPRPRHTKGVKNGTGSSLADATQKGSARKLQESRWVSVIISRSKSSTELMLSVSNATLNKASLSLSLSLSCGLLEQARKVDPFL